VTTAVDTSVILDLLTDDPRFAASSQAALKAARAQGRLIVCECVLAELRPALGSDGEMQQMLDDLGIDFVCGSVESALLAGRHLAAYLQKGGPRGRVVADFLIGAHAEVHADRLLARDRGFLRDYFGSLKVVDPSPARSR
jgi:predicted nucleic acid-binding protein